MILVVPSIAKVTGELINMALWCKVAGTKLEIPNAVKTAYVGREAWDTIIAIHTLRQLVGTQQRRPLHLCRRNRQYLKKFKSAYSRVAHTFQARELLFD